VDHLVVPGGTRDRCAGRLQRESPPGSHLVGPYGACYHSSITSKETILELIRNLPDDVSAQEIVAHILNHLPEFRELENREKADRLVESWLEEKSGYDARIWSQVLEGAERNRLAGHPRFGSSS